MISFTKNYEPVDMKYVKILDDTRAQLYVPGATVRDAGDYRCLVNQSFVCISDVKVVEAMYTTKNKYFDKHPLIQELSACLTGNSILFAETSDDWRKS